MSGPAVRPARRDQVHPRMAPVPAAVAGPGEQHPRSEPPERWVRRAEPTVPVRPRSARVLLGRESVPVLAVVAVAAEAAGPRQVAVLQRARPRPAPARPESPNPLRCPSLPAGPSSAPEQRLLSEQPQPQASTKRAEPTSIRPLECRRPAEPGWRGEPEGPTSSASRGGGAPSGRGRPRRAQLPRERDPHRRFQLASGGGPPWSRVRLWINCENTYQRTRALLRVSTRQC